MILEKTREEVGFSNDRFPGYILYSREYSSEIQQIVEKPIIQIHLYPEYYTVFWKGSIGLLRLHDYIGSSILDISEQTGVSIHRMNSGNIIYSLGRDFLSRPFVVNPEEHEQQEVYRSYYDFLGRISTSQYFIRFDVLGVPIPIIFRADSPSKYEPEIGFSSIQILPRSIMRLFRESCYIKLDSEEYKYIESVLINRISGHP
jgi:hypothetical protein